MRGRPKLSDSRDNQYRVRLNDEESRKLNYVSETTGKPKSEVFRYALIDYYNKVRLNEANNANSEDVWEIGGISLKRVVNCPHCNTLLRVDLENRCNITTNDGQMGPETLYEFELEDTCDYCGGHFLMTGYISEYPAGALNHEDIVVLPTQERGEGL